MIVRSTRSSGALILHLERSETLDCHCAEAVKQAVLSHLDGRSDLVIDLGRVEFMDSAGVAVLVSVVKAARLNGSQVVFAAALPGVLNVLELIRLDQIFHLQPDVASATRYLAERRASLARGA